MCLCVCVLSQPRHIQLCNYLYLFILLSHSIFFFAAKNKRCVGKYDTKKTSFVCMKVRTASNPELFKFGSLIEHTSEYLRANYL